MINEQDQEQRRIDRTRERIRGMAGRNVDFLAGRKKDIVEFRRYAWEDLSHAKAPELFDRQEFERQENEYVRKSLEQTRLADLYPNPYFARIDFREDGARGPEAIYIGKYSLMDDLTYEMLVCDWRAPVASMYYDCEYGRAAYESPEGPVTGELSRKRQFVIENGVLRRMFDSALEVRDTVLQEMLAKGVDDRMRTIVTTIQRGQNRAIRDEKSRVLLISGPAGSGKTSVAMHRIAYLLYRRRKELTEDNFLIFSPDDIFSDYISGVLPSLGEKPVAATTFDEFAFRMLGKDVESREQYVEAALSGAFSKQRRAAAGKKGTRRFTEAMERAAAKLSAGGPAFRTIEYRGAAAMTAEEMSAVFRGQTEKLTVYERLAFVRRNFFRRLAGIRKKRLPELYDELIKRFGRSYFLSEREIRRDARALWYKDFLALEAEYSEKNMISSAETYAALLADVFGGEAAEEFRKAQSSGRVSFEDAAPLLYLKLLLGLMRPADAIRQVVVDEAQDYSFLQYRLFSRLFFRAGFTILGDEAQTVLPSERRGSLGEIAGAFEGMPVGQIALGTAYRSTAEIGEYAASILGGEAPAFVDRHGEKPELAAFADEEEKLGFIRAYFTRVCSGRTAAVITRTVAEAKELYRKLGMDGVRLVSDGTARFRKGWMVLPSYLAKGLEFDCVVVDDSDGGMDRNLLYTCCTRALHRLAVIRKKD